jgi:hypothetical protein
LCWPIPGKNSLLVHNSESRELKATCEELGLLALGQTTASRYQFAITLQQTPWVGDIGVFFGYRVDGSGDQQTRSYQTLTLHAKNPNAPGQAMWIDWSIVWHECTAQGGQRHCHQLANSPFFSLEPNKSCRLTLAVGPIELETVTLDKNNFDQLCAAVLRGNARPKPANYTGPFGVYLYAANATFADAGYLFHKEPP